MREDVELSTLTAVSPVDGRYARRTASLRGMTSEYALIGWRVNVEVAWFQHLAGEPAITELPPLSSAAGKYLDDIVTQFDPASAEVVKALERTTNHDVKAVEYYLKERLQGHPELGPVLEFVHFGCTSEDVNNVAYAEIFEAGRVAFGMDAGSRKLAPGTTTMVVRMTIDYLAQLHFPGAVRVGTRVLSFGRSSCLLGQALFADGRCVATSDAVSVLVDLETNRSTPMPDALRASYRALSDG
ncbi:MAG: thioesterase family protein [Proteobacteria bacterium]|nr:thioesterase family protein [Pseudomonadota bacterium]